MGKNMNAEKRSQLFESAGPAKKQKIAQSSKPGSAAKSLKQRVRPPGYKMHLNKVANPKSGNLNNQSQKENERAFGKTIEGNPSSSNTRRTKRRRRLNKQSKTVEGQVKEATQGNLNGQSQKKNTDTSKNVNAENQSTPHSLEVKKRRKLHRKQSVTSGNQDVERIAEPQDQKPKNKAGEEHQSSPDSKKLRKGRRRRRNGRTITTSNVQVKNEKTSVNVKEENSSDSPKKTRSKKSKKQIRGIQAPPESITKVREMREKKRYLMFIDWPYINTRDDLFSSSQTLDREAIRSKLKETQHYNKIKELFETNNNLNAEMMGYEGWSQMKVLKCLDDVRSFLDSFPEKFRGGIPWKEIRGTFQTNYTGTIWKKLNKNCPSPTLKQSLNYAKVFLMKRFPKDKFQKIKHPDFPKRMNSGYHLLQEKILKLSGAKLSLPIPYVYNAMWRLPRVMFDKTSEDHLKEFYIALANFFKKYPDEFPYKTDDFKLKKFKKYKV